MKRYYIGIDDRYTKLWATTTGDRDLTNLDLGIIEVGWLDFWLYRLFSILPIDQDKSESDKVVP